MNRETRPILVIAEHDSGNVRPVTYELLAFADKIRRDRQQAVWAVILGDSIQQAAEKIARTAGIRVLAVSAEALARYNGESYKYVLHQLAKEIQPAFICAATSSRGSDFAPGLAARIHAACITQVEGIQSTPAGLSFTRSILGGKIHLDVRPLAKTVVLTLQPGMVPPLAESGDAGGKVILKNMCVPFQRSKTIAAEAVQSEDLELAEAKAVVSAGRGIGDETHLSLVYQLAACIPHAIVAGSRPVIDLGWLPYNRQVGVTGATVSPELYVACGISGAEQHVSGMRTSGFVVAINSDPTAAIFNLSDVCIVEDLKVFIPAFITELKNWKGNPTS